jgi:hypothetical protein
MWQVRNAQTPFLTKKRSFDLAWGAWAGILAVMTAVGAAFASSQMLMMHPRPVKYMIFKYPSMPRSETANDVQMSGEIPVLYLSREGVVVGQLSDVSAPVRPQRVMLNDSGHLDILALKNTIRSWVRSTQTKPVHFIAVGHSDAAARVQLDQISQIVSIFGQINSEEFKVDDLHPSVIPLKLANSM